MKRKLRDRRARRRTRRATQPAQPKWWSPTKATVIAIPALLACLFFLGTLDNEMVYDDHFTLERTDDFSEAPAWALRSGEVHRVAAQVGAITSQAFLSQMT